MAKDQESRAIFYISFELLGGARLVQIAIDGFGFAVARVQEVFQLVGGELIAAEPSVDRQLDVGIAAIASRGNGDSAHIQRVADLHAAWSALESLHHLVDVLVLRGIFDIAAGILVG